MLTVRYTVIDGEVVSELRGGVKRDYVPDPLGSTVALLDATQTKTDTFQYWPYGESAGRTGTTATPFQYVGTMGYYTDSSGRNYVRARYLDKAKGRWVTEDPITFLSGEINFYRYSKSSPILLSDPTGFYCSAKPHPCSSYPGGPCQWAAHNDPDILNVPSYGAVICCDNKKYTCVWHLNVDLDPVDIHIHMTCIGAHEDSHHDDVSCPESGYDWPPTTPPKRPRECRAHRKEIECLRSLRLKYCSTLPPQKRAECYRVIDEQIQENCEIMKDDWHCRSSEMHPVCSRLVN
jgi:RHS repeat-associated protein